MTTHVAFEGELGPGLLGVLDVLDRASSLDRAHDVAALIDHGAQHAGLVLEGGLPRLLHFAAAPQVDEGDLPVARCTHDHAAAGQVGEGVDFPGDADLDGLAARLAGVE